MSLFGVYIVFRYFIVITQYNFHGHHFKWPSIRTLFVKRTNERTERSQPSNTKIQLKWIRIQFDIDIGIINVQCRKLFPKIKLKYLTHHKVQVRTKYTHQMSNSQFEKLNTWMSFIFQRSLFLLLFSFDFLSLHFSAVDLMMDQRKTPKTTHHTEQVTKHLERPLEI